MKEQSIYQIKEEMNKSNQTSDAQRWCLVGFNIWSGAVDVFVY